MTLPAVIFSGGSEIVSLSLADTLSFYDVPLIIVTANGQTIIPKTDNVLAIITFDWRGDDGAVDVLNLLKRLEALSGGHSKLVAFASEDGSLRFLLENSHTLQSLLKIYPKSNLRYGGLDKAEFFSSLSNKLSCLAESYVFSDFDRLVAFLAQKNSDYIIKPAMKPCSMSLGELGKKVFQYHAGVRSDLGLLERSWFISEQWVVQKPLLTGEGAEISWYGARLHSGKIVGMTAREERKYPAMGGSACYVCLVENQRLCELAESVLKACDFIGMAEISFLQDSNGDWKVIELNPRPWLQIGLADTAQPPLSYGHYRDACHRDYDQQMFGIVVPYGNSWVCPERLIAHLLTKRHSPLLKEWLFVISALWRANYKTIYSTSGLSVKFAWLLRLLKKVL